MLELAILGFLKEQDLHGYELKKRLSDTLGPLSSVSFGSLYPALARLEASGAVRAVEVDEAPDRTPSPTPVPMTGSLGGELAAFRARSVGRLNVLGGRVDRTAPAPGGRRRRTKKVYGITDRGQQMFEELLAGHSPTTDDERTFNLRLTFARHLQPEARLGLLERRRAQLVERLASARAAAGTSRGRLDAYTRSLLEHGTETTERDISWLDRLIAAERRQEELA